MSTDIKKPKKSDLHKVDPRSLKEEEGFNVRTSYDDDKLEELKQSIIANGVQKPLKVRNDEEENMFKVIDGHRRNRAIQKALKEGHDVGYVPVMKASAHSNEEDDIFDLIIQNDGEPLTLLEQGEVFKRLVNKGYEIKEIAERIGKTQPVISNGLTLANASKKLKNYIANGQLASSTALSIIRKESDSEKQVEMVQKALSSKKEASSETKSDEKQSEGSKGATQQKDSGSSKKSQKVTKRDVLGESDPIKKLGKVEKEVKGIEFDHSKTALLKDLRKALKEDQSVEDIVELFKKEDKRTTLRSERAVEKVNKGNEGS